MAKFKQTLTVERPIVGNINGMVCYELGCTPKKQTHIHIFYCKSIIMFKYLNTTQRLVRSILESTNRNMGVLFSCGLILMSGRETIIALLYTHAMARE